MFEAFAMNQVAKGMPNRMINVAGMFIRDIQRSFTNASKDEQQAAIEDYYNLDQVRNAIITTTSRSSQSQRAAEHLLRCTRRFSLIFNAICSYGVIKVKRCAIQSIVILSWVMNLNLYVVHPSPELFFSRLGLRDAS